jgi:hypothetical protein
MTQATAYYNQLYHDQQYNSVPPNVIRLLLAQCNPATRVPFTKWRLLTREAYLLYDAHQMYLTRTPTHTPSNLYNDIHSPFTSDSLYDR